MGRGGRPRHPDHRGGPRPHDPTRAARPSAPAQAGPAPIAGPPPFETVQPSADIAAPHEPVAATFTGPGPLQSRDPVAAAVPVIPDDSAPDVQGSATAPPMAALPDPPTVLPALERHSGCTTAQLRRFIKSRAYVPMHEIRRRFLLVTEDDDVAGIDLGSARIFVGLPAREGQMLGDLLRGGEIGYELQLDPVAPVVVGVYPMRPVTRG
jgi:hypothetical protein